MEGITMKHLKLGRILSLAVCICLAVTLLTAFSPARSAHAATTNQAACANLNMFRGVTWYVGTIKAVQTCKGATVHLQFQLDGNFVLYVNGHPKWASNTSWSEGGSYVEFQPDGNLVVYDNVAGAVIPVWSSGTNGKSATRLSLQDDGNLVIYTAAGKALW